MRRWRIPLLLSALVLLGQLTRTSPLIDVVTRRPPSAARLAYPWTHVLFAPLTLLADWLNGGSRQDLKDFLVWLVLGYALARLLATRRGRSAIGYEAGVAAGFAAAVVLFFTWAIFAARPIPRLVADGPDALVFDVHSHTSASHDGRRGFGATQNAWWHRLAGFDAAFVTDHNVWGAARLWRMDSAGRAPRLLEGEELSLWGLHLIVLGNSRQIANEPWNASWDSTLALIRRLSRPDAGDTLLLVASLPEYWRNHWGDELGQLVDAGVRGFEVWTSSPAAMDFPEPMRQRVIARARLSRLVLVGATDMHGLGRTATVWNVTAMPGWRTMTDDELGRALVRKLRSGGDTATSVIAARRWLPASRVGQALAVPAGLVLILRTASWPHALALLAWIWIAAAVTDRIRTPAP